MPERRKLKRRKAKTYLGVYRKSDNQFVGWLVDLTPAGLQLMCDTEIEMGACFQFRVDLPAEIMGSAEITFDTKVIWCKKNRATEKYHTGFELQNVSETEIRRIELLIERSRFQDAEVNFGLTLDESSPQ